MHPRRPRSFLALPPSPPSSPVPPGPPGPPPSFPGGPPFAPGSPYRPRFWRGWGSWGRPWYPQVNYQDSALLVANQVRNLPKGGYAVGYVVGQIMALRSLRRNDLIIGVPSADFQGWQTSWNLSNFQAGVQAGIIRVQNEYARQGYSVPLDVYKLKNDSIHVWVALNT